MRLLNMCSGAVENQMSTGTTVWPLVSYNEISGGHIGRAVVVRRCSAGPVLPLWKRRVKCLCRFHQFGL